MSKQSDLISVSQGAAGDPLFVNAANNRVGIGTSNPTSALTVSGSITTAGSASQIIVSPTGGAANLPNYTFGGQQASTGIFLPVNATLGFSTAGVERLRITSAGNVGIGVSSVSGVKMEVLATVADNLVARFENNHVTGSYGISVKAGDDSGNYSADFANKSGTSLMRIRGDGNVGIGTNVPAARLDVNGGLNGTHAIFSGQPSRGLVISTANTSGNDDAIVYNAQASTGKHIWQTNATERARIDASGNLLVGTTDPLVGSGTGNNTQGLALSAGSYGGYATFSRSGSECLNLNRIASDGTILNFRKDGTTVGSIGVTAETNKRLYIGKGDTGIKFDDANDLIAPISTTSAGNRDAAVSLGTGGVRFKDLYLSGGVYLGGTGSANLLDDYEEGTFTPTLFGNVDGAQPSYQAQSGTYVKAGNLVFVAANIRASSGIVVGSNTRLDIGGFPFGAVTLSGWSGGLTIGYRSALVGAAVPAGSVDLLILGPNGGGNARFHYFSTTADLGSSVALIQNNTELWISGTYRAT